jgi:hypothetical protein
MFKSGELSYENWHSIENSRLRVGSHEGKSGSFKLEQRGIEMRALHEKNHMNS